MDRTLTAAREYESGGDRVATRAVERPDWKVPGLHLTEE